MPKESDDYRGRPNPVWMDLYYELSGRTSEQGWKESGSFKDLVIPESSVHQELTQIAVPHSEHRLLLKLQARNPTLPNTVNWRMVIHNDQSASVRLGWISLQGHFEIPALNNGGRRYQFKIPEVHEPYSRGLPSIEYLHNGWQSWSYAGWHELTKPVPRTRMGRFTRPMQEAQGFPTGADWDEQAYSEMYTILRDRDTNAGIVAGYLSQRQAFGRIYIRSNSDQVSLTFVSALDDIELAPGDTFHTDWAWLEVISSVYPGGGDRYFNTVGEINHARHAREVPVGWCSWYTLYTGVSQADILRHASWSESHQKLLPLDVIQIDDGFQAMVGDWYDRSPEFPDEMKQVADRIRRAGKRPGLWLAPFLADRRSSLVREHPGWVLRHADGSPVNPGWGWNSFPRVLDITHPEVLDSLAVLVGAVSSEWGYSYLKLDFLYAGALPGAFYNQGVTRAQAMATVLGRIREAAGDQTTLLGCGCPLGAGIGTFDVMRIGPDVAPHWKPRLPFLSHWVREDPGLPAARNAIRNTILRAAQHRRWWINDPDCVLLRDVNSQLSESEVRSICSAVALSSGAAIFSDKMMDLSEERLHWGSRILPPLDTQLESIWSDQVGSLYTLAVGLEGAAGKWMLLGVFNLRDGPETWDPGPFMDTIKYSGEIHCVDFWEEEYHRLDSPTGDVWTIPPRSVRCVALRKHHHTPQWLGSTMHLSQGQEIRSWNCNKNEVSARIGFEDRQLRGKFWVAFPGQVRQASIGSKELSPLMIQSGIYKFEAQIQGVQDARFVWSEG